MSSMRSASSRTQSSHVVEAQHAPRHEVEQPARSGDDHVGAAGALRLRADRDAAVDGGDAEAPDVGDDAELLDDLRDELAGRHQDEGRRAPVTGRDAFDDRDREGERLARAGPGAREDVPPGDRVREDERLDRERGRDAAHRQCLDDGG